MDIHIIVKLNSSYEAWHNLFLKDADIFETPIELFYSRRIGEKAWGEGESVIPDTLTRYYGNFQDCGKFVKTTLCASDQIAISRVGRRRNALARYAPVPPQLRMRFRKPDPSGW